MFFVLGQGCYGLFNEISQGKIFDFIIEDFRFGCLQTEMHFLFCVCVCYFGTVRYLVWNLDKSSFPSVFTFTRFGKGRAQPFSLQTVEFVQRTCIHLYRKEPWLLHTHEHEQTVKSCSYFSRCPNALIYWPEFSSCCVRCRKILTLFSCLISETSMMSPSASLMRPEFRLTADFFKEFFSRPLFFSMKLELKVNDSLM